MLGEPPRPTVDDDGTGSTATQAFAVAGSHIVRLRVTDDDGGRIVIDPTTGAIDCTGCKRDFAPVFGFYTYDVKITPATLVDYVVAHQ